MAGLSEQQRVRLGQLWKEKERIDPKMKNRGASFVTINSMADHNGEGMRIETFARLLFDQWEIGHAELRADDDVNELPNELVTLDD